jgi:hypothetical protein
MRRSKANCAIRDVIGHTADYFFSVPSKKQKHSVKGVWKAYGSGAGFESTDPNNVSEMHGNLVASTYVVSYKGSIYKYDITSETATRLIVIKRAIYASFASAVIAKP